MKKTSNNKMVYILNYFAAFGFYGCSILNFINKENIMGGVYLCVGSVYLCIASIYLSKDKNKIK